MTGCTAKTQRVTVGKPAPVFDSFGLDGRAIGLAGWRGHPVLVNFWASWCEPCKTEFPVLKAALLRHPDLAVLGVVHQDSRANAAAFLRSEGATWPAVIDPNNQIASAYGVNPIPVTIAIDAAGIVRARQFGVLRAADADRLALAAGA